MRISDITFIVLVFPDRSFENDLDVINAYKTYFLIIHILFHFFKTRRGVVGIKCLAQTFLWRKCHTKIIAICYIYKSLMKKYQYC